MKPIFQSRITRECSLNDMYPELTKAFNDLFAKDEFPGADKEIITCFETKAFSKKLFRTKIQYTGIVLTPKVLFWGIAGTKYRTFAAAVLIKEIADIRDYEKTENFNIMEDHGLEIFGFTYRASKRGSWFIGLGDDEDGQKCRKMLRDLRDKV